VNIQLTTGTEKLGLAFKSDYAVYENKITRRNIEVIDPWNRGR